MGPAGGLNRASCTACQRGLDGVIRVGPLGDKPGASKLAKVRFLDPADHGGAMTVGLRWEAARAGTGLFPVLLEPGSQEPNQEPPSRCALQARSRWFEPGCVHQVLAARSFQVQAQRGGFPVEVIEPAAGCREVEKMPVGEIGFNRDAFGNPLVRETHGRVCRRPQGPGACGGHLEAVVHRWFLPATIARGGSAGGRN
jgi:hypothetical protein